ncbi:MAG: hypothetical protein HY286_00260 [Planctomycetes bacterium]|nr:hypothetical protein [Planctomycetota bacterium]
MTTPLNFGFKSFALGGAIAAMFLAIRRQEPTPIATAPASALTVSVAVEYRSELKNDMPIASATENVVVYTVPGNDKLTLKSYMLPLGVSLKGTAISPLGLGIFVNDRLTIPKTVRFLHDSEDVVHLDPGVEFPPGSRVAVRFAETVKGLSGSLFLNGELAGSSDSR